MVARISDKERRENRAREAAAIAAVKDAGRAPEECGPEMPVAPARGPLEAFMPRGLLPRGAEGYVEADIGHRGRHAARRRDVFDRLEAMATTRGDGAVLGAGQVQIGRRYRDLVEAYATAGSGGARAEPVDGGGGAGHFMDALLAQGREIDRLHNRIGDGIAKDVRRVSRGKRAGKRAIFDKVLVRMVCVGDLLPSEVLARHGWAYSAPAVAGLTLSLAEALTRMEGPRRSRMVHSGAVPDHPFR